MKTILSNISGMFLIGAACLLGAGSMTSCTDGFEDANRPGNKIDNEQLNRDNFASGSFLVQLQNQTFPEQENAYQVGTAQTSYASMLLTDGQAILSTTCDRR